MKPKLAIIGPRGYPANFSGSSGIDTYIEKVIPFLKDSFDINLYSRQWSNSRSSEFKIHPIFCLDTPYFDTSLYSIFATIAALIDKNDIFWFHAPGSCLLLPIVKLFGKKIVVTIHGIDWQRQKWSNPITKFSLLLLEKIAIYFSDEITTVSSDNSQYIQHQYHHNPVSTFPGFEAKKIYSSLPYILYLGRLVPEKNIELLIIAYLQNKSISSKYKLVIAGKIENNKYCRQIEKISSNNSNVIFTNYLKGTKKEKMIRHAKLFVLPSNIEGHPLALSEALSYGLPCLVSDIPIHRELSKTYPNITLFKNESLSDLQNKFSTAIKLSRQISHHETNSWQTLADHFIHLLNHL